MEKKKKSLHFNKDGKAGTKVKLWDEDRWVSCFLNSAGSGMNPKMSISTKKNKSKPLLAVFENPGSK